MKKRIPAPSVINAALTSLRWSAQQAQAQRGIEKAARERMVCAKVAAELAETEVRQLEGFLRDAGVPQHKIDEQKEK